MFDTETAFYKANKQALREQYLGKQIVIIGEEVVGVYDTVGDAYRETAKTVPPGSFMIKDIPVDIEDEVAYLSPFAYA